MRLTTLLLTFLLAGGVQAQDAHTITVRGEGSVAAAPDMATINLGVTTRAGTAAEALERNSDAMTDVMERLRAEGVAERDLQTATLNLSPRYAERPVEQGQEPEITGYAAENTLTVRVRELERLGEVLAAVAEVGANTFRGLSFGVQEPEQLRDEALRMAVADARSKAELLAEEAGVALDDVQSIDATGRQGGPIAMQEARMAMDSVPVAGGEVTLDADVTVVFGIAAAE